MDLTEAELKVMRIVWRTGKTSPKPLIEELANQEGYNPSTTYTVIYRLIKKKALERIDPGFELRPLVSQDEVRDTRIRRLMDDLFDGSADLLFASLVDSGKLSHEAIERMSRRIDEYEHHHE